MAQKVVNFSVIKEKIIKTDEVLQKYLEKINSLKKAQVACKDLKAKYDQALISLNRLELENDRCSFSLDSYRSKNDKLELENVELKRQNLIIQEQYNKHIIESQSSIRDLQNELQMLQEINSVSEHITVNKKRSSPDGVNTKKLKDIEDKFKDLKQLEATRNQENEILQLQNQELIKESDMVKKEHSAILEKLLLEKKNILDEVNKLKSKVQLLNLQRNQEKNLSAKKDEEINVMKNKLKDFSKTNVKLVNLCLENEQLKRDVALFKEKESAFVKSNTTTVGIQTLQVMKFKETQCTENSNRKTEYTQTSMASNALLPAAKHTASTQTTKLLLDEKSDDLGRMENVKLREKLLECEHDIFVLENILNVSKSNVNTQTDLINLENTANGNLTHNILQMDILKLESTPNVYIKTESVESEVESVCHILNEMTRLPGLLSPMSATTYENLSLSDMLNPSKVVSDTSIPESILHIPDIVVTPCTPTETEVKMFPNFDYKQPVSEDNSRSITNETYPGILSVNGPHLEEYLKNTTNESKNINNIDSEEICFKNMGQNKNTTLNTQSHIESDKAIGQNKINTDTDKPTYLKEIQTNRRKRYRTPCKTNDLIRIRRKGMKRPVFISKAFLRNKADTKRFKKENCLFRALKTLKRSKINFTISNESTVPFCWSKSNCLNHYPDGSSVFNSHSSVNIKQVMKTLSCNSKNCKNCSRFMLFNNSPNKSELLGFFDVKRETISPSHSGMECPSDDKPQNPLKWLNESLQYDVSSENLLEKLAELVSEKLKQNNTKKRKRAEISSGDSFYSETETEIEQLFSKPDYDVLKRNKMLLKKAKDQHGCNSAAGIEDNEFNNSNGINRGAYWPVENGCSPEYSPLSPVDVDVIKTDINEIKTITPLRKRVDDIISNRTKCPDMLSPMSNSNQGVALPISKGPAKCLWKDNQESVADFQAGSDQNITFINGKNNIPLTDGVDHSVNCKPLRNSKFPVILNSENIFEEFTPVSSCEKSFRTLWDRSEKQNIPVVEQHTSETVSVDSFDKIDNFGKYMSDHSKSEQVKLINTSTRMFTPPLSDDPLLSNWNTPEKDLQTDVTGSDENTTSEEQSKSTDQSTKSKNQVFEHKRVALGSQISCDQNITYTEFLKRLNENKLVKEQLDCTSVQVSAAEASVSSLWNESQCKIRSFESGAENSQRIYENSNTKYQHKKIPVSVNSVKEFDQHSPKENFDILDTSSFRHSKTTIPHCRAPTYTPYIDQEIYKDNKKLLSDVFSSNSVTLLKKSAEISLNQPESPTAVNFRDIQQLQPKSYLENPVRSILKSPEIVEGFKVNAGQNNSLSEYCQLFTNNKSTSQPVSRIFLSKDSDQSKLENTENIPKEHEMIEYSTTDIRTRIPFSQYSETIDNDKCISHIPKYSDSIGPSLTDSCLGSPYKIPEENILGSDTNSSQNIVSEDSKEIREHTNKNKQQGIPLETDLSLLKPIAEKHACAEDQNNCMETYHKLFTVTTSSNSISQSPIPIAFETELLDMKRASSNNTPKEEVFVADDSTVDQEGEMAVANNSKTIVNANFGKDDAIMKNIGTKYETSLNKPACLSDANKTHNPNKFAGNDIMKILRKNIEKNSKVIYENGNRSMAQCTAIRQEILFQEFNSMNKEPRPNIDDVISPQSPAPLDSDILEPVNIKIIPLEPTYYDTKNCKKENTNQRAGSSNLLRQSERKLGKIKGNKNENTRQNVGSSRVLRSMRKSGTIPSFRQELDTENGQCERLMDISPTERDANENLKSPSTFKSVNKICEFSAQDPCQRISPILKTQKIMKRKRGRSKKMEVIEENENEEILKPKKICIGETQDFSDKSIDAVSNSCENMTQIDRNPVNEASESCPKKIRCDTNILKKKKKKKVTKLKSNVMKQMREKKLMMQTHVPVNFTKDCDVKSRNLSNISNSNKKIRIVQNILIPADSANPVDLLAKNKDNFSEEESLSNTKLNNPSCSDIEKASTSTENGCCDILSDIMRDMSKDKPTLQGKLEPITKGKNIVNIEPSDIVSKIIREMDKDKSKVSISGPIDTAEKDSHLSIEDKEWRKGILDIAEITHNDGESQTVSQRINFRQNSITPKSIRGLSRKHELLMQRLLRTSKGEEIEEDIILKFKQLTVDVISDVILQKLSRDFRGKPEMDCYPATLMTKTQRIFLSLIVKLENEKKKNLIETFLAKVEYLFFSTQCQIRMITPITRLYMAICRLKADINRMRMFCCDAFFYMKDLAVPLLFTVLTSWIEVLPKECDLKHYSIAKLLVQLVHLKTCNIPGYNLLPLKCLLSQYYGYPKERWNCDELFKEIFQQYLRSPGRVSDLAIRLFCRNKDTQWVYKKINEFLKPLIYKIPAENENFRATTIILLGKICRQFKPNDEHDVKCLVELRRFFEGLNEDETPQIVKKSIFISLKHLPKKKIKKKSRTGALRK